jgi:hypothetical protein
MQDIFLNGGANPPHGIGGQAKAAIGVKALDRLHHAHIAFGDQFPNRQAIAAIAHGDLGHEAQMRGDEAMSRLLILSVAPAAGEFELFLRPEHREFPDVLQVTRKIALRGHRYSKGSHADPAFQVPQLRPVTAAPIAALR